MDHLTKERTAAGVKLLNRTHTVAIYVHGIAPSGLMKEMSNCARPGSRQEFHSICRGKPRALAYGDVDHKTIGLVIPTFFKNDRTRRAGRGVAKDPRGLR